MPKKILIIGDEHPASKSALALQVLREKYGEDVVFYNEQQAKEEGLDYNEFANIPLYKITAPAPVNSLGAQKSGKELRRERRQQQRKYK